MFTILKLMDPADFYPDMQSDRDHTVIHYPASPFEPWSWCFMENSQHEKAVDYLRRSNPEWFLASASFPALCGVIEKQVGFP